MAQVVRWIRPECGHVNDQILFTVGMDEKKTTKVYCMACFFEFLEKNFGFKPSEILTGEQFLKKYAPNVK